MKNIHAPLLIILIFIATACDSKDYVKRKVYEQLKKENEQLRKEVQKLKSIQRLYEH